MPRYTFGQGAFGVGEFGDGSGQIRSTGSQACTLTYTIIPPGRASAALSYHVEPFGAASATLSYWVAAPIQDFSINGSIMPKPHHVIYDLPRMVGDDLSGIPIRQGYTKITWVYDILLDNTISLLMQQYDPANPQVWITYLNEFGTWTQKLAMMQPPNLGQRTTIQHASVQIVFTHITSD